LRFKEGDGVIYTKTGTTGKVVKLYELDGKTWAELDSTGLLYEENSLEPAAAVEAARKKKEAPRESKAVDAPDLTKDEGRLDTSGDVCGGG